MRKLKAKGNTHVGRSAGFTGPEMAFLLFVVALFLAGTVWVVNSAIVKSHPMGKSDVAGRDAERALDRIESLVKTARAFEDPQRAPLAGSWTHGQTGLMFFGDLDGDPKTGAFKAMGQTGLEQVRMYRRGDRLVVEVKEAPGAEPRTVVLLDNLSPGDPGAFTSSFKVDERKVSSSFGIAGKPTFVEEGFTVNQMLVSLTTGVGQSRLVLARSIGLLQRPVVIAVLPRR